MKRATQFIIMVFIIGSFVNIGLSQDTGNPFAGYWKTERGTIIKIEGDQGTCVSTPVISWKEFVGEVVIKNIRQEDENWIADEFLLPGGKGLWAQIGWDYQDDMIVRQVTFQGKPVLSYYEKTDASWAVPARDSHRSPERKNYILFKAGIYTPTDDLDDAEFDTGFNGEVAFGHYFNPNFAIEGGIGYFQTEASFSSNILVWPYLIPISEDNEVRVIPFTLTAKGIYPTERIELYLGGGVGIYYAEFESDISAYGLGASLEDDDTVFGVHFLAGANVNLSEAAFLGVEAKYIWTEEGTAEDTVLGIPFEGETNLNGYTITGNIGFRF